jgi:hypothetical protein
MSISNHKHKADSAHVLRLWSPFIWVASFGAVMGLGSLSAMHLEVDPKIYHTMIAAGMASLVPLLATFAAGTARTIEYGRLLAELDRIRALHIAHLSKAVKIDRLFGMFRHTQGRRKVLAAALCQLRWASSDAWLITMSAFDNKKLLKEKFLSVPWLKATFIPCRV